MVFLNTKEFPLSRPEGLLRGALSPQWGIKPLRSSCQTCSVLMSPSIAFKSKFSKGIVFLCVSYLSGSRKGKFSLSKSLQPSTRRAKLHSTLWRCYDASTFSQIKYLSGLAKFRFRGKFRLLQPDLKKLGPS